MEKRYIKKVTGVEDLVIMKKPPLWGKIPDIYRARDWNINNTWFTSTGADILDSVDPFNDGSLLHKWRLNGTLVDLVTGNTAISVGKLSYSKGVFDSKCFSGLDNAIGGTYLDCGVVTRGGTNELTISGWINISSVDALYSIIDTNNIWRITPDVADNTGNSRQPSLFCLSNNTITIENDGTVTNAISNIVNSKESIFNKWSHVVQTVNGNKCELYIDNVLMTTMTTTEDFLHNDGTFLIGDKWHASTNLIQQVEIYNKVLNTLEIQELYNQQRLVINKHDNSAGGKEAFSYIEEDDKLVELITDKEGNLISKQLVEKEGYLSSNANLLQVVNDEITDRYGNNVLAGTINRVIQNTSYTRATVSGVGTGVWATFNAFELEMNTDKYDYIISITNAAYSDSVSNSGVDINISANNKTLVTTGHIGHGSDTPIYLRAHTYTPKVTSGFVGLINISAQLAKQETTDYTISNHDNGGVLSGRDTLDNKSDFIVFEIHKEK